MEDKRKNSTVNFLSIKGSKVPAYNFSDLTNKQSKNIKPKVDLRNKKQ